MTLRLWRLTRHEHAPGLDGEGARLFGGQWNSPGYPAVYGSLSLALALFEIWVHLPTDQRRRGTLPRHVKVGLDLPAHLGVERYDPEPNALADRVHTRGFGDAWLSEARTVALLVPSAIMPEETNVLLNPLHPDLRHIAIAVQAPFTFDDRLAV